MDDYESTMRKAVTHLRATSARMEHLARKSYMCGPFRRLFDEVPTYVGVMVLPEALRQCVHDASVVELARLSHDMVEVAERIDAALESGWNGITMPSLAADIHDEVDDD